MEISFQQGCSFGQGEEMNNGKKTKEQLIHELAGAYNRISELEQSAEVHKQAEEEKTRLEIQLIQARKIEALGKFSSVIAHDFKNILQPILINAELLSDLNLYEKQEQEYLDEIIEAAQLGKNLVSRINQFDNGNKICLKPITLRGIVQEALTFIKRSLPVRITFRQWVNAQESRVRADPTQFYQLIVNLCMNSVQAMSRGKGFLGVSLKETEVAAGCPALVSDLDGAVVFEGALDAVAEEGAADGDVDEVDRPGIDGDARRPLGAGPHTVVHAQVVGFEARCPADDESQDRPGGVQRVFADDFLELARKSPAMELVALPVQTGHPGVFPDVGEPDWRGCLGKDEPVPLDVGDDRPADVDLLFQLVQLEDKLYVGSGNDVHDRLRG